MNLNDFPSTVGCSCWRRRYTHINFADATCLSLGVHVLCVTLYADCCHSFCAFTNAELMYLVMNYYLFLLSEEDCNAMMDTARCYIVWQSKHATPRLFSFFTLLARCDCLTPCLPAKITCRSTSSCMLCTDPAFVKVYHVPHILLISMVPSIGIYHRNTAGHTVQEDSSV